MRVRAAVGLTMVPLLAVALQACGPGTVAPPESTAPAAAEPTSTAPARPGAPGIGDEYFPGAGNGGYDVRRYDIELHYDPSSDRLTGRTTITASVSRNLSRFNLDLALPASAVQVDGARAEHTQTGTELVVTPDRALVSGNTMTVRVDYAGAPSQTGADSPWVRTADGAVAVGEPEVAAWWFPSNDHPVDKANVAVTVTVPRGVEALSNGKLLGGPEPAADGQHRWRWRAEAPMSPYLAFVAIGQYELVQRDTPAGPYLAGYAEGLEPEVAAAARESIEQTPQIVGFLSELFGEYPFAQLGGVVPNAPNVGFALENQTRPVYSPAFFAAGTDVDVVVHELAHQWFGDSVGVRRWRDIWLNEGFATYTEWLYSERTGGASAQQITDRYFDAIPADSSFWQVPPGDPGADDLLDRAVYVRGAMALHAIRVAVGDETFLGTLRAWAQQRRGGSGTVEDFIALAEQRSGRQLDQVADAWLYRSGRPDRIG
ncbi:MAG: M1 family peptidase [Pseudonocardiaceae bacterium]|nr:M1 family peptidase [Pseudonocardiaceae bacterium]